MRLLWVRYGFPGKGDSPQASLVLTPPSHLGTPTADTGVTPAHGPDGVGTLECPLEPMGLFREARWLEKDGESRLTEPAAEGSSPINPRHSRTAQQITQARAREFQ